MQAQVTARPRQIVNICMFLTFVRVADTTTSCESLKLDCKTCGSACTGDIPKKSGSACTLVTCQKRNKVRMQNLSCDCDSSPNAPKTFVKMLVSKCAKALPTVLAGISLYLSTALDHCSMLQLGATEDASSCLSTMQLVQCHQNQVVLFLQLQRSHKSAMMLLSEP